MAANPKIADELKATSRALTRLLGARATILDRSAIVAKILAAMGAAVLAISKVVTVLPPEATHVAAAVVFFATILVLFADKGKSSALADAREAMDKALDRESELESELRKYQAAEKAYNAELERLSHFQAARDLARAIFEEVATSTAPMDELAVIDLFLKQARRSLFLAHGFDMNDFHTICVYQRVDSSDGGNELVCKAHIRAIDCELAMARTWKAGVGAAGAALARREEVLVPDLKAPQLGSLYGIPEKKTDDEVRYRSIVAEPIALNGKNELWGVLVATSSRAGHFSMEDRSYADVAQSLAGMISLAVKLVRAKHGQNEQESQR